MLSEIKRKRIVRSMNVCVDRCALRAASVLLALVGVFASTNGASAQSFNKLFPPEEGKQAGKIESESDDEGLLRQESREEKLIDAFVMRQVKFNSDSNPDPSALPHFTYQFRKNLRMRAQDVKEHIKLSDPEIFKWPMLYITAHNSFAFTKKERENLKKYLKRGGRILADDCSAGGGGFAPSFMSEIRSLFPGKEFVKATPDHPRFGVIYNILYQFNSHTGHHDLPPEVLTVNGRVAVMIDHDDPGCAWEVRSPPTSARPLGKPVHNFRNRSAYFEFGFNYAMYFMTH